VNRWGAEAAPEPLGNVWPRPTGGPGGRPRRSLKSEGYRKRLSQARRSRDVGRRSVLRRATVPRIPGDRVANRAACSAEAPSRSAEAVSVGGGTVSVGGAGAGSVVEPEVLSEGAVVSVPSAGGVADDSSGVGVMAPALSVTVATAPASAVNVSSSARPGAATNGSKLCPVQVGSRAIERLLNLRSR
jgi:hypothetical protein